MATHARPSRSKELWQEGGICLSISTFHLIFLEKKAFWEEKGLVLTTCQFFSMLQGCFGPSLLPKASLVPVLVPFVNTVILLIFCIFHLSTLFDTNFAG